MTDTQAPTRARLGPRYWRLWSASVVSNLGDGVAMIAYPWLASAVTRSPFLIALIAVVQRLPWLIFTLPAGVITDRADRKRLIFWMNLVAAALSVVVAVTVLAGESRLPSPESLTTGVDIETNLGIYLMLLLATFGFGFAEVLRDNASQTILPAIVDKGILEKANGNLWGAEMVANSFVGPPLGSLMLGAAFALPFFFDAGSFAVAAVLIATIQGNFKAKGATPTAARKDFRGEIKEGFVWLWRHPLLRPLAIVLGLLNGLGMMTGATFILFAQENLDLDTGLLTGVLGALGDALGFETVGALVFAILMTAGAIGGILGSVIAARVSQRLGPGRSLAVTIGTGIVTSAVIGVATRWWLVFLMHLVGMATAVIWNVITVSLRQTIIPDELLGRVNSVYRFFGWGMMPIGSAIGGVLVAVAAGFVDRELALRLPYFVAAAAFLVILFYAAPRLATEQIEAAKAEAAARAEAEGDDLIAEDAIAELGIDGAPPPPDEAR